MPLFTYKAIDANQNLINGVVAAIGREELANELIQQGYTPLKINPVAEKSHLGRLPVIEKITLCRYLATMIKSGLTLVESIQVLSEEVRHPVTKKILEDVKYGLNHGQTLSSIFNRYPASFNNFFVTLIRSGEVSGTLVQTFEQLQEEIRAEYSLTQKIQSAMMYPLVVFTAMAGIGVLMVFFILPQIGKVFFDLRLPLNPLVKLMFSTILILSKFKIYILIGSVISIVSLILFFRTMLGRKVLSALIAPVPVVKNLIKQVDIARFCRTFSTLIASGVPITIALEISLSSLSFSGYKKSSQGIIDGISKGKTLALAFRGSSVFPPLLIQMLVAGEKSGTLDSTLKDLAEFYEEEVENAIKKLTQLLEPVMMLLVGIGVGVMILTVITPIYSVVSNISAAR